MVAIVIGMCLSLASMLGYANSDILIIVVGVVSLNIGGMVVLCGVTHHFLLVELRHSCGWNSGSTPP